MRKSSASASSSSSTGGRSRRSCRSCASGSSARARTNSRRACRSSSRSRSTAGGAADGLRVGLGQPAFPRAARRGRDGGDRRVVLLLRPRQPLAPACRGTRQRARCRRRVVGDPRWRLLPDREVPRRAGDASVPLHWFKWEAYTTWLSGFALFIVVYYVHASTFLVDPSVRDLG